MRGHVILPLPQLTTVGLGEVEVVGHVYGEGRHVDSEGNGVDMFDVVLNFVQVDTHLLDGQTQVVQVRIRPTD